MAENRQSAAGVSLPGIVRRLKQAYGDDWSFDIVEHTLVGGKVEVMGELRANGSTARARGQAPAHDGSRRLPLGERLQMATEASLALCAFDLLGGNGPAKAAPIAAPVRVPRALEERDHGPAARESAPPPSLPRAPAATGPAATSPAATSPAATGPGAAARPAAASPTPAAAAHYSYDGLDPVTLRVVGGAFNAIAKEMAHVLYRMSYSSIIRESEDLGCGIFDAQGNELCESESTPMHIGSLPWYIRGFMRRLAGKLHEGDVVIHNHPYFGASHSPDLAVAVPIFHQGGLLGFAACTAHLLDVGGAAPGINVDVVDVYAEAKLFNAIKLFDRGVRNEEVWQLIRDNVRTPDMDLSDIEAMIASVQLGRERFLKLLGKYGVPTVMGTAYYWMDYSEKMLRAEIAKIPDGEYHAEGWLDDDGKNRDRRLKVNVTVRVQGTGIEIDLTGSAPEVETGFNVPFEGSLLVACYYVVRTLLLDEVAFQEFIPQNEGIFRPVKVIAPKGTIFNPNFPRACFSRFAQIQRVVDCVIHALAPVIPEKATGGNSASLYFISYSGFVPERQQYWMYLEVDEGSYGGRFGKDGMDCVDNLVANTRNNPVEELDMHYPLRNERYELRPDPPAAGKWRGGIGVVRENRFLEPGYISCEADRHFERPHGVFGGEQGYTGSLTRNPGTPQEEQWPSKITGYRVDAGDLIRITAPSGGGYGNPRERDPELVLSDYLDDFISLEIARDTYGVAIDPAAEAVNAGETRQLRGRS
jgi:N-methylhydantoinase B/oxoprolinase/acetone carboxylase alpha subunit